MRHAPAYQESELCLPTDTPMNRYTLHQQVMSITNNNKAITYAPLGSDDSGRHRVLLRSPLGTSLPDGLSARKKSLRRLDTFFAYASVRLFPASDQDAHLSLQGAVARWIEIHRENGFQVDRDICLTEAEATFTNPDTLRSFTIPYWLATSQLRVIDPVKAVLTMIYGLGYNRGLGFGMLMVP